MCQSNLIRHQRMIDSCIKLLGTSRQESMCIVKTISCLRIACTECSPLPFLCQDYILRKKLLWRNKKKKVIYKNHTSCVAFLQKEKERFKFRFKKNTTCVKMVDNELFVCCCFLIQICRSQ